MPLLNGPSAETTRQDTVCKITHKPLLMYPSMLSQRKLEQYYSTTSFQFSLSSQWNILQSLLCVLWIYRLQTALYFIIILHHQVTFINILKLFFLNIPGNLLLCIVNKNLDDNFWDGTSITITNFKTNKESCHFQSKPSVTIFYIDS